VGAEPQFAALAHNEGEHVRMSPPIVAVPADDEQLEQTLSGEPSITDHRRDDGVFIEVRRTQLPDGGFVQTLTDITTRREAETAIARLASEDPLTGLPNRRVFSAKLQSLCDEGGSDFAILFMDMDRFKLVNDTLGHRVGDGLLIAAAARLQSVASQDETVARLGGDEFAVIIPRVNERGRIEGLAKKIVEIMSRPFEIDHHRIRASVSIGIAVGPHDGQTADGLLGASDLALYAVKLAGRGSYRFFEKQMNDEVNERRDVELELRQALEQGRMEMHFQPIVDLASETISGFEGLARWQHPTKGYISPAKFIAVAEDCGLIIPLGEWALMEACRAAAKWPAHMKISVNVSPLQLTGSDLPATVLRVLGETGIAPHRLALEFTERIFIEESDKTHSALIKLKNLGVQIVLDDFGTGYSSLSYLRRFPFDGLKIDRSFISGLGESTSSNTIVQAVILIAGTLGIRTVAEGVESAPQMQMLKLLGCNEVQGYLLSKPVPLNEATALLQSWTAANVRAA
jgi:diguanylate cyclase (GGDEF)-like protein